MPADPLDDRPATMPPLEVAARVTKVRTAMVGAGLDALVVSDLVNLRWLTGFVGTAGTAVVRADELVVVVDGRYAEQAAQQLADHGVPARVAEGRTRARLRELGLDALGGASRVGLEADALTWAEARSWCDDLAASAAETVPVTGLVGGLRAVKDGGEIARVAEACRIAGAALEAVVPLLGAEITEAEFAAELEYAMRRRGSQGPSFDTIVAAGPNAALPHHRPGDRRIVEGDLVIVDFGATVDGYRSDMTRTVVVGEPTAEQRLWLDLVEAANAAGVAAVRPGARGAEVDAAARAVIDGAGLGELFVHGTGHGVGLRIHEAPWALSTSSDVLVAGNLITVEPGVYRFPLGGVRVEDLLLVCDDGCRPLTTTPKDLPCPPSPRTT
ncbi:MAG: M24 family metallopeptidase [Acidimicrobiales bacterium]